MAMLVLGSVCLLDLPLFLQQWEDGPTSLRIFFTSNNSGTDEIVKSFNPSPPFQAKRWRTTGETAGSDCYPFPCMSMPRYPWYQKPNPQKSNLRKDFQILGVFFHNTHVACNLSAIRLPFFSIWFHGGWPFKHIPLSWKLYRPIVFLGGLRRTEKISLILLK